MKDDFWSSNALRRYTFTTNYLGVWTSSAFIPGSDNRLAVKFKESAFIPGSDNRLAAKFKEKWQIKMGIYL